jgi:hypothetical protein
MYTVSAVILTYSLLFATSSFVDSKKHKIPDNNLSKRNVHNRTDHTSMLSHGSFYRVSISYGVWEEKSTEAKRNQNGSQSKFYGTSDTEASEASALDMDSTENEVKNGFDYTDVAKTEFATTFPPLDLSPDKIIDVPRRKCPAGTKMDPSGKCKTVW